MRNISIELKIILAIVFFTLLIVSLERYKLSGSIIEQFIESKKSKNELLVNTISPIISLNLFLGLDQANHSYLDQIVKQNSDLDYIELIDINGNTTYTSSKEDRNVFIKDKNSMNFSSKEIVDTVTADKLATIKLYFSNSEYELVLEKNRETTIQAFSITFVLLILFILLIKREFKHLKELSNNVLSYDPKADNLILAKSNRLDEVGIIHNAIATMEERISSHTKELDEVNSSLEEKVELRTKELDELNKSLNEKVSLAVEELEQKSKLLLQQSRLAQMGEMISMIAHQWRQPLASISSVICDLTVRIQLNRYEEKIFLEKFKDVDNYTQYLSSTINDFRNFFEPTNEKKETTYQNIIDDTLKIVNESLNNKKIKINKSIKSNNIYLTYDNELKQVILNLIANAIDILIEKNIKDPEIILEVLAIDNKEVLRIIDNGGGIEKDILNKIFDPYFSTKKNLNGTGLGLYMSKIIIEEHCKGKLIAYNKGPGAVFEITLP